MVKSKVVEVTKYLQQCLKETGLDISKIILFGSQSKEAYMIGCPDEAGIGVLIG
ncbi:MAG: hypothetical protein U9P81_00655 [Euryarchaeota archaeon]|nr:hypothetical protein [Euryarchaeota archaeon]